MFNHRIGNLPEAKEHAAYVRAIRAEKEAKRIAGILAANPQIGVLNGGKFYAYVDGVYVESKDPANLI